MNKTGAGYTLSKINQTNLRLNSYYVKFNQTKYGQIQCTGHTLIVASVVYNKKISNYL
jgi:uncharacterized membrane protein